MKVRFTLALFTILFTLFLYSCQRNNIIEVDEWKSIFSSYNIDSACFELADNTHDQILLYNLKKCSKRIPPGSTFDMISSLVALETATVPDENFIVAWDTAMSMKQAFANGNDAFFQQMVTKIGRTELQNALDTIRYGNKEIGDSLTACWQNGSLQITPDEQVGLVKKLYFDKLPFSQRSHRIVKKMMLKEDSLQYKLYYTAGTTIQQDGQYNVTLVGFVERKETQKNVLTKLQETNYRPYFFSLNYETGDLNLAYKYAEILKKLLKERAII